MPFYGDKLLVCVVFVRAIHFGCKLLFDILDEEVIHIVVSNYDKQR